LSKVQFKTTDGGINWSAPSRPALPSLGGSPVIEGGLNGIACDAEGTSCTAVGNYLFGSEYNFHMVPLIYNSIDGGTTWTAVSSITLPTNSVNTVLNSIRCNSLKTTCSAAGDYYDTTLQSVGPVTYLSTDNGVTWSSPSTHSLAASWLYAIISGL